MVIEHNMKGNGMKWKVSMRDEFGGSGTAYIEADTIVQAMREGGSNKTLSDQVNRQEKKSC